MTIYFYENSGWDSDFSTKTISSFIFSPEDTLNGLNVSLLSIQASMGDFKTDDIIYSIANNTYNVSYFPAYSITMKYAQQFTLTRPTYITYFSVFVDYTSGSSDLAIYLGFYRNLNESSILSWTPSITIPAHSVGWKNFTLYIYLKPGTYYFVLYYDTTIYEDRLPKFLMQNNCSENKGYTKYYDGNSWNLVSNDERRDILSKIYLNYFYYPNEINLTLLINGDKIDYQILESSWELRFEKIYYFSQKPTDNINVTLKINRTLNYGYFQVRFRYFGKVKARGIFKLYESSIIGSVMYFVNTSISFDYYLLYPKSWILSELYNPFGNKVDEYFVGGNFRIYDKIYWGIANWMLYGNGIYRANFTIPNIIPNYKIQLDNSIISENSIIELGRSFRIQASIYDSEGNPISYGTYNITIIKPDGSVIYLNGLINNGSLITETINTNGWTKGSGKITIFWTDGSSFSYTTINYTIVKNEFPWVPILITIGIVGASIPASLYVKRKIKERNWEKSLLYIFGLTKDGISIFGKSFRLDLQDPALISGMISAITNFVSEAMKSKKSLRSIDHEDKKVLLAHGQNYIIALMTEKDLKIIRDRLDQFAKEFGEQYGKTIKHWNGDVRKFKEVDKLIDKYFPLSEELKLKLGVGTKLNEIKELLLTVEDHREVLSLLKELQTFAIKYQEIINTYFTNEYNEILQIIEDKLSNIS